MLTGALWFKFLLNKIIIIIIIIIIVIIANTCLFTLTSFSFLEGTWDLWIVCTAYWLARDVFSEYTGSSSYSFDWGGITERTRYSFTSILMYYSPGYFQWGVPPLQKYTENYVRSLSSRVVRRKGLWLTTKFNKSKLYACCRVSKQWSFDFRILFTDSEWKGESILETDLSLFFPC